MGKFHASQIFLHRFLPLVQAGRVHFLPRGEKKTFEFLAEEGLNSGDVFTIIAQLKPEDHLDGPEDDYNGTSGTLMSFTHPYKDKVLYIKLKLWTDASGAAGLVMSFHESGMYD